MVAAGRKPTLVAIVGPTASGKSELAMMVATAYNGEIIAADSRTIYRGMDIGTAKPDKGEQAVIRHWGLDLVEPGEAFSAHRFKTYAADAISNIQKRGKLPILVGGTGLYIDSVLYDFEFNRPAEYELRQKLELRSVEELHQIIKSAGYPMPVNSKNKRHLVRAIETAGQASTKTPVPLPSTLIVGLMPPDEALRRNIKIRAGKMFRNGLIKETEKLLERYSEGVVSTSGIAYRVVNDYLAGRLSLNEAKLKFEQADWQYARRQRTWFSRNKFIHWFQSPDSAFGYISKILNN